MTQKTAKGIEPPVSDSSGSPLVSVCMTTYNHRRFISSALDSVLMQETDFPFEIILHDDCSTDGTTDIVRSYVDRHPGLIRPIIQTENQYSKGNHALPEVFQLTRGRCIAILEGDDAWTDPQKLRLQVEFLEGHPECIMCYGNAQVVDEHGKVLAERKIPAAECRPLGQRELMACRHLIPTATVMFRNHPVLRRLPAEISTVLNGDSFLYALLAQYGTAGYVEFSPSVYRQHAGGIYSSLDTHQRRAAKLRTLRTLRRCIAKPYRPWVADSIAGTFLMSAEHLRRDGRIGELFLNILGLLCFSAGARRPGQFAHDIRSALMQLRKLARTTLRSVIRA